MIEPFVWGWASVDHVVPVTRGGKNDIENYVTACWKCNLSLKNKIIDSGKSEPINKIESEWDGFSGLYPILLEKIGRKKDEWALLLS